MRAPAKAADRHGHSNTGAATRQLGGPEERRGDSQGTPMGPVWASSFGLPRTQLLRRGVVAHGDAGQNELSGPGLGERSRLTVPQQVAAGATLLTHVLTVCARRRGSQHLCPPKPPSHKGCLPGPHCPFLCNRVPGGP